MVTRLRPDGGIMYRFVIVLLAAVAVAQEKPRLPGDLAAMHPEGKWKIRKTELYRYLVRFNSGQPNAKAVFPDYLKRRMVEARARKLGISVTEQDVQTWLDKLDARIKRQGGSGLDELRKSQEMRPGELRRRGRLWIMQLELTRKILAEKDLTRSRNREVPEDTVMLTIDEMFRKAPKVLDGKKLPRNVVARIDDLDITEYAYGRALAFELPATEVYRALLDLILAAEVNLLTGNDDPPSEEDRFAQEKWYLQYHKNRLRGQVNDPDNIDDAFVKQLLARQGLPWRLVRANPGFLAQAKARGHFKDQQTEAKLRAHYDRNKARFGDKLKIARILIKARAQNVVNLAQKTRTLEQGKALAQSLWIKIKNGDDFGELARQHSDDPDVIRLNGGKMLRWFTAETPGQQDVYLMAKELKRFEVSKPFFSRGRGYVLVRLLDREKAGDFQQMRKQILTDAAEREYQLWRRRATRAAIKNEQLLDDG